MTIINMRYVVDVVCHHRLYVFIKRFHNNMRSCCVYSAVITSLPLHVCQLLTYWILTCLSQKLVSSVVCVFCFEMLQTLYTSKIPLRLTWSVCSAFFYFAVFIVINRSGIFKRYNVVSVREIWVGKRMHPYRSTKNKIPHSSGSLEVLMN